MICLFASWYSVVRLAGVCLDLGRVELRGDLGIREAELVGRLLEEGADEVIRVSVVARPAEQVQVACLALLRRTQVVGAPRCAVRHDLEAGLVQARREGLEVPLRVGHVRPRNVGRVPEVDLERYLDARLLEQRLRLRRVVRVLGDVVGIALERRRHELLRHLAAAGVEVVDDGLPVEPVRQPPGVPRACPSAASSD